jgi:hypothetical protein
VAHEIAGQTHLNSLILDLTSNYSERWVEKLNPLMNLTSGGEYESSPKDRSKHF